MAVMPTNMAEKFSDLEAYIYGVDFSGMRTDVRHRVDSVRKVGQQSKAFFNNSKHEMFVTKAMGSDFGSRLHHLATNFQAVRALCDLYANYHS